MLNRLVADTGARDRGVHGAGRSARPRRRRDRCRATSTRRCSSRASSIIAHGGTPPARTMMLTVTRPLEQAMMEVPGIRRVRSTTFRGATEISAQFDPATDMIVALQQAQSRIAETRGQLPADTDLIVERLTPAAFPDPAAST